jgi:hypothetical protein
MSRDQYATQSNNLKIDNRTLESVEQFKYLGKNLTYQNTEENKTRLKSGNICYHSMKNFLSSSLLDKNLKIKI